METENKNTKEIKFTPEDDLIHLLHLIRRERALRRRAQMSGLDMISLQRRSKQYQLTSLELETEIDQLCKKYCLHE